VLSVDQSPLSTSSSLIERVGRLEPKAWCQLVEVYGPLVYRWGRQSGLQPADAADVVQEAFRTVHAGIAKFRYHDSNSSFLGWLRTIVRSRVADHFRRAARQPIADGGSTMQLHQLEDPKDSSCSSIASDRRDRLHVLRVAAEQLKQEFQPSTWIAFWRVTVDGLTSAEVATELKLSVAAVRQANYRVRQRLRTELRGLWEAPPSPQR
jgi:RNA polymerase sigma-70 factor (ECF subfamily)